MADTSNSVLFDAPGPKGRRTIRIVNWIAGILFAVVLVFILMRLHNPPDGENQLSWELWKPAVEREAWTDFYLPGLWMTIKATIVAVVGAVVRLAPEQAEAAQRAKKAAEALGIECILLNAEALAQQPEAAGAWPQFAALLTAADKLGIQYIGSSSRARLEVGTDGVHTVLPPVDAARDDSTALAALPQETLARLLLPLGEFDAGDLAELAQELQL
mgnify:CR=1 FL=1